MLAVSSATVSYGSHRALEDVSIRVGKGEICVILGANGAGKSSLLNTIAGRVKAAGRTRISISGKPLSGLAPHDIVEAGVALVPEGRGIFGELTVAENLSLGAYAKRARECEAETLSRILSLFPRLGERRSQVVRTMSGGEQQMVAIGRALMSNPDILMLDEPSLGLSPLLCGELFKSLKRIGETGMGILLVEQNARQSLAIADRGYLLENGTIVGKDSAAGLLHDPAVQRAYLGGAAAGETTQSSKSDNQPGPTSYDNQARRDADGPPDKNEVGKMARVFEGMYMGGSWTGTSRTFSDFNPSDGSVWAEVPDGGRAEARAAIEAAHKAFPAWAALPHSQRAHYMVKIAQIFEKRRMDIVEAVRGEGGGWFGKAMFETGYVPEVFYAAAASNYASIGEVLPSEHGKLSMAVRRPMGVVSVISPWNFPVILTSRGLAFAVAAGNTIVLKPSEETPYLGGLLFAEIFAESGVPDGVLNVVTCSRDNVAEMGDELIENPLVKGVSFTGSTPVGRQIAAKAGQHLKKCCVELGGKDSLIVLDDADMERATQAANFGSFMHQGQICMSVEKVLVHEKIHDEFLQKFVERAAKLKVGDTAKDKDAIIGPLINDRQVERVKGQIDDAVAKGARVVLGGGVNGRFVEPTILTGVTPDMRIYQEETFGPVVPVIPFASDDEAISIANDTEYGLSSGVITRDEERALAIANRLDTGMCHVNCSSVNDEPHVPFGGSKASGVGRHGGRWATETFTETRWITLERGGRAYPPVF